MWGARNKGKERGDILSLYCLLVTHNLILWKAIGAPYMVCPVLHAWMPPVCLLPSCLHMECHTSMLCAPDILKRWLTPIRAVKLLALILAVQCTVVQRTVLWMAALGWTVTWSNDNKMLSYSYTQTKSSESQDLPWHSSSRAALRSMWRQGILKANMFFILLLDMTVGKGVTQ